jgi:hypothetical protein
MGVELGLITQGSVSQPTVCEDFLNGPRNNDSDDIETYFHVVLMTLLKVTLSTVIYDCNCTIAFISHYWDSDKMSLACSGTRVRGGYETQH